MLQSTFSERQQCQKESQKVKQIGPCGMDILVATYADMSIQLRKTQVMNITFATKRRYEIVSAGADAKLNFCCGHFGYRNVY